MDQEKPKKIFYRLLLLFFLAYFSSISFAKQRADLTMTKSSHGQEKKKRARRKKPALLIAFSLYPLALPWPWISHGQGMGEVKRNRNFY